MKMMEKEIKIQHRQFKNASVMKFDNRRVMVHQLNDGGIGLTFKIKATDEHKTKDIPPSYEIRRGKIVVTKIKISPEAAYALLHALYHQLSNQVDK